MTICPIAIVVGCKKCPLVKICPVKEVIGNYKKEEVEKLLDAGVVLKDLDEGLVNFFSMHDGREIYLCWRLGEEGIDIAPQCPVQPITLHADFKIVDLLLIKRAIKDGQCASIVTKAT